MKYQIAAIFALLSSSSCIGLCDDDNDCPSPSKCVQDGDDGPKGCTLATSEGEGESGEGEGEGEGDLGEGEGEGEQCPTTCPVDQACEGSICVPIIFSQVTICANGAVVTNNTVVSPNVQPSDFTLGNVDCSQTVPAPCNVSVAIGDDVEISLRDNNPDSSLRCSPVDTISAKLLFVRLALGDSNPANNNADIRDAAVSAGEHAFSIDTNADLSGCELTDSAQMPMSFDGLSGVVTSLGTHSVSARCGAETIGGEIGSVPQTFDVWVNNDMRAFNTKLSVGLLSFARQSIPASANCLTDDNVAAVIIGDEVALPAATPGTISMKCSLPGQEVAFNVVLELLEEARVVGFKPPNSVVVERYGSDVDNNGACTPAVVPFAGFTNPARGRLLVLGVDPASPTDGPVPGRLCGSDDTAIIFGGPVSTAERLILASTASVIVGDINITSNAVIMPAIGAAFEPVVIVGKFEIADQMESFELNPIHLRHVSGAIRIAGNGALSGASLPALTTVGGALTVENNGMLTSFDATALTTVGGNINVTNNDIGCDVLVGIFVDIKDTGGFCKLPTTINLDEDAASGLPGMGACLDPSCQ
jgi:hypothetical protein